MQYVIDGVAEVNSDPDIVNNTRDITVKLAPAVDWLPILVIIGLFATGAVIFLAKK